MQEQMINNSHELFEIGVADYFRKFGHREAREKAHQAWLLISVAKHIDPQLVVAELPLPNPDLNPFGALRPSGGGVSFDFAITRSEIDVRTWKTRTPGWNRGLSTVPQTLETPNEVSVLAELKISKSTSTKVESLNYDLLKLRCAIRFMEHNNCKSYPRCYFVVLDPDRKFDTNAVIESIQADWPSCAPLPKILTGPL